MAAIGLMDKFPDERTAAKWFENVGQVKTGSRRLRARHIAGSEGYAIATCLGPTSISSNVCRAGSIRQFGEWSRDVGNRQSGKPIFVRRLDGRARMDESRKRIEDGQMATVAEQLRQ